MADLDKKVESMRDEAAEADNPVVEDINNMPSQDSDALKLNVNMVSSIEKGDSTKDGDYENKIAGEVNMEAALTTDDIIRAGGFGATDDISSFLPVAVDSTDFESSLRDARDFEEPQGEISRPGLGWAEEPKHSN
ncbi:hypothetical protein AAC387_Pa03g1256 [Persea americana]